MLLDKMTHDQLSNEAEKIGIRVNGHICNILEGYMRQMKQENSTILNEERKT